mmetsp:Transcript_17520/g.49722  ORF Transcript_17520/g.49722 Transcript_17520/m.49722 type:complete len:495 (+) Transcript_17520:548-2032(+)
MSKPIDYSKWNHLDDSSDDEDQTCQPTSKTPGKTPGSLSATHVAQWTPGDESQPTRPSTSTICGPPDTLCPPAAPRLTVISLRRAPQTVAASRKAKKGKTHCGVQMPITFEEMPGWMVRKDPVAPDASVEVEKCIVCRKLPPAGREHFMVCSRCVREVSPHYCGQACLRQHFGRGQHLQHFCETGRYLYDSIPLRGNSAAVKYVLGWMDEDTYMKLQRRKQKAILAEIDSNGEAVVKLTVCVESYGTSRVYCVVSLTNESLPGHEDRTPPPDTGGMVYREHGTVIYSSFIVAPVSTGGLLHLQQLSPEMREVMHVKGVDVMQKTTYDLLSRQPPLFPAPLICDTVDSAFWRGEKCALSVDGEVFHWYFLPHDAHVLTTSLRDAAGQLFGPVGEERMTELLAGTAAAMCKRLMGVKAFLSREEWRKAIVQEITQRAGLHALFTRLCGQRATQRDVSLVSVKTEYIETVLPATSTPMREASGASPARAARWPGMPT